MIRAILCLPNLAVLFCLVFSSFGCGEISRPETPRIAISMATFQIQRWAREANTITQLANQKGLAVITLEANNDIALQKQQIAGFIEQRIPIILIVAVDGKALVEEVKRAHEHGLHVIAYDRLIPSPLLDAYISFDNVEVGRQQALALVKAAPSGNYVLLGGSPTDNNAHAVRKGQLQILAPFIKQGKITIIEDPFIPNWEAHLAFLEMETILKKHANRVDAVVASNDGLALGAIQALKIQDLAKKIPISGQDASTEGCKAIVEGDLTVSVFKNINQLAPLAFEIAEKIVENQQLNLNKLPLQDLSSDPKRTGYVPCKFLAVTAIDKSNLYEKIILTQFHEWGAVYKDIPVNQRPPRPESHGTGQ